MRWFGAVGLGLTVAVMLVLSASRGSDHTPVENWQKFRVPRFPWMGNTWFQVDGGYGIGQGKHVNQDQYALDVGLPESSGPDSPVGQAFMEIARAVAAKASVQRFSAEPATPG